MKYRIGFTTQEIGGETAEGVVETLKARNAFTEGQTVNKYMAQVSRRRTLTGQPAFRTDTAAHFLADIIEAGWLVPLGTRASDGYEQRCECGARRVT